MLGIFHNGLNGLNNSGWGGLDLSILWSWLPSDIVSWITTFIVILFLLALKRLIFG